MEKEQEKYVFGKAEDVMKLESDELRVYAKELQQRLADEEKRVGQYQKYWYEESRKVDGIKADVETLKKIFNLIVEKW